MGNSDENDLMAFSHSLMLVVKRFLSGGGILILLLCSLIADAQSNQQLKNLQVYLEDVRPVGFDSSQNYVKYMIGEKMHYLYPLYQLYVGEKKFRNQLGDEAYYNQLSEAVALNGDYASALEYQLKTYTGTVDDVDRRQIAKSIQLLKDIKQVDARKFIAYSAAHYKVVMLNEAYNKPLHRAFAISLLNDMYKRGFRYLAMEMLNPFPNAELTKLTSLTGHYSAEPVAGELIRTALDMGFKLIAYDDTASSRHTARQRDSIQAVNLYKIIQEDSSARIFVYAGYGHIAESSLSNDYIPMAMAFKKLSGIDPLTIDQTNMCDESSFPYGKAFYETYIQRFPITSPSIALDNNEPVNITGSQLYDLTVVHPKSEYKDARPDWLSLDGRRQPLYIKSSNQNTFMVQAYYQFESFGTQPAQVIPADQTYIPTGKGTYLLYLRKGIYILIFRDIQYRALYTQHIEVN